MKRFIPLLIAGVVFLFALAAMRPEKTTPVVVAASDLPAGHTITDADLTVQNFPKSLAPGGAFSDPAAVAGQTLRVDRNAGDVIYPTNLGGESLELAPDERAIAIEVQDSSGLAGLLEPGNHVGVTAVVFNAAQGGAYSKTVVGGLRVLYVSPEFEAVDPMVARPPADEDGKSKSGLSGGLAAGSNRKDSGVVVLAVPITARAVVYDFSAYGVPDETRLVYAIDLLPALDQASNVALSLFLEPDDPQSFVTSGLYLPDLVITPGPSPTPTETPYGWNAPIITAIPTATPEPTATPTP